MLIPPFNLLIITFKATDSPVRAQKRRIAISLKKNVDITLILKAV